MNAKPALLLAIVLALLAGGVSFAQGLSLAYPAAASPSVTLSPTSALPNQAITVSGSDFSTNAGATVASISVGGTAVSSDKISAGSTVNVDSSGNFVATLIIPMNSATLVGGSLAVVATDSRGLSASRTLTIAKPALTVSPISSRVGTAITITGSNFPVDSSRAGADNPGRISVEYQVGTGTPKRLVNVNANTLGAFVVSVDVPLNTPMPSTDNIVRAVIVGTVTNATAKHSVPKPVITISPTSGTAGTIATLTGAGLRSFAPVSSVTLGGRSVLSVASLYTDKDGRFSITFTVPQHDGGAHPVSASVGESEYLTSFNLTPGAVAATPVPPVFPGRSHNLVNSLAPLEGNLVRVFSFDNGTKQWKFYDPRPEFQEFNSLDKLVEGQAYWIQMREDQVVSLRYRMRNLYGGWNLIPW